MATRKKSLAKNAKKKTEPEDEPGRDQLRMDMMRSVVTEPLLTQVHDNPKGKFEVIISLNELFEGGIAGRPGAGQEARG